MPNKNKIYFDYAATTPVDPRVKKAMDPYFSQKFGNTMSLHSFGQEAKVTLE
jgi:cysteine desulfurase